MYRLRVADLQSLILVYSVWPWYSTWAIRERQSCTQKLYSRLQDVTSNIQYVSADWYTLISQGLKQVAVRWATWVLFLQVSETLCCPSAIFSATSLPCINKRFAVKNSGISCLALIFNLSIPKLIILCSKLRDMTSSIPFFSVDRYKLMAQWLRRVAVSRGAWVQILQGTETFCLPSAILRGTEPVSALARALLYCCALYNFYFLDFLSGDLALTGFYFLTWTSDFNCFGALGVGPGARTWLLAWRMGRDFSFCRASEQKCLKRLGHCFPLNFRKHWKSNGPSWRFFQPSSLRLIARVEKGALKTVETNTTLCPQLSSPKLLVWTAGPI